MVTGIIPLYDREKDSYWMLPGYMKMLEEAGAVPMMLPLTEDKAILDYFLNICDGFLLTGGQDVSPSVYGEKQRKACGETCPDRDRMETYLLRECVRLDKPVLGICRGIQFMNACFGGTLYQDLPTEYEGYAADHHMEAPYDRTAHLIEIAEGSLLHRIMGEKQIGVNSCHHQGVKELAPVFEEMARAEDGLIEAIYMPGKRFIVGVQWHPEFAYRKDLYSRKLVEAFVESADQKMKQMPAEAPVLSAN